MIDSYDGLGIMLHIDQRAPSANALEVQLFYYDKEGDYVVLDGGQRGKVINIGLRSTHILTRDDIEITVPNSIIGNTTIVNQSGDRPSRCVSASR